MLLTPQGRFGSLGRNMRTYRRSDSTARLSYLLPFVALYACSLDDRSLGGRQQDEGSNPSAVDSSNAGNDSEGGGNEQRPDSLVGDSNDNIDEAPVIIAPTMTKVRQLSAGYQHACAIREDQSLWCWGGNELGALGIGVMGGNSAVPQPVSSMLNWQVVATGYRSTCAISDGSLYCWGDNTYGTLGLGSFGEGTAQSTPQRVGTFDDWVSVSTSSIATCAIRQTQQVYCWGALAGTGTSEAPQPVPTQVGTATGWTQVAVGNRSACGILGGRLHCWGDDPSNTGVLGTGNPALTLTEPTLIDASFDWQQVSIGTASACGIRGGELYCWGINYANPSGVFLPTPTRVSEWTNWSQVSISQEGGCAVRTSGDVWCWGTGDYGVRGPTDVEYTYTIVRAETVVGFQRVEMGYYYACGLRNDDAYCWGHHWDGRLGVGDRLPVVVGAPAQVGSANTWTDVVVTRGVACGVMDGHLFCWGDQRSAKYDARPQLIDEAGLWSNLSSSDTTTFGLRDGQLFSWRSDLFDPFNATAGGPQLFAAVGGWHALSASQYSPGYSQLCAIGLPERSLFCAGRANANGRLGTGDTEERTVLTQIGALSNWQAISSATYSTCGIESGRLYCWGENGNGQLGLGDAAVGQNQLLPQQVGTATGWTHIASQAGTTCGIESGQLHCWGILTATTSPTRIGTADDWTNVAAGALHACAIRGGELYCWGDNGLGQLGLGTASIGETIAEPTRVGSESDWIILSLAPGSTCGIRGNGTLWCWGSNEQGQLGLGASWSETPLAVQWP